MKKNILVYGLIAGAIVSTLMAIGISLMHKQPDHQGMGMVIGYSSMLLAFTFIFIAIKTYRDKHLGGRISFGKAFSIGLGVAVIASLCYTITWVILYKNVYPNFLQDMFDQELSAMRAKGMNAVEIATKQKEMEGMTRYYNTWPGLIGFTLIEILPLGVLVALISSFILRQRHGRTEDAVPQTA